MKNYKCLNGNILKIIALITMTVDHIGYNICDNNLIMRGIGRIAFPIFAYMIAEGCKYTKNRKKHLLTIAICGICFQTVYSLIYQSFYLNIFITFTLSVILIYAYDCINNGRISTYMPFITAIITTVIITAILPRINESISVDYGLIGVLIPLLLYISKNKNIKLIILSVCLILNCINFEDFTFMPIKLAALGAVILLKFYNGERGKLNLKYLFYIYYPLHLTVIYIINCLINK